MNLRTLRRRLAAIFALLTTALQATGADFPQGLVLHYGFDDAAAVKSVPDLSGRGQAGRGSNVTWAAAGRKGGAADFAAAGSCIVVPATSALAVTQLTLAAWFKIARTDGVERCLFERGLPDGYALTVAGAANRGRLRLVARGQECLSDAAVTDGAWRHVVATCDGRAMKLYVDGQLQKQVTPVSAPPAAGTNALRIGRGAAGGAAEFSGLLDEVMVFNHAISAEQAQAVLAAAKQKFSEAEVKRRLGELKDLLERGLILPEFYERKVKECQVTP